MPRSACRKVLLACHLCRALLAALMLPEPASGTDAPRLEMPQGRNWIGPTDALLVRLPPALSAQTNNLHLELDAIDVTDLVQLQSATLRFEPPQALESGNHELRLVEFRDDGNIVEQGVWNFEVRHSAAFQERTASAEFEAAWRTLASKRNIDATVDQNSAQAALDLAGNLANSGYSLDGRGGLVSDGALAKDQTQLYDILLTAAGSHARLRLGQHDPAPPSLVMENFTRRGLSTTLQMDAAKLTGFAMRTDTISALADGLGLGTRDKLTTGVNISLSPLRSEPRRLVLQATYLRGRGSDQGVAELGDDQPQTGPPAAGDAWSLALDSYHLDQRLRLYAELARSRYDFDGDGNGFAAQDDNAFRLLMQYRPQAGDEADWLAGLQLQQVGTGFRSIANATLPTDRRSLNATLELIWNGLSADLLLGLERDNLEGRAQFPTVRSSVFQLNFTYTPQMADTTGYSLLANPSVQFGYARIANRQIDSPALYSGEDIDNVNDDLAVSIAFAPGTWNWSLGYQFNRVDEDSDLLSSTRSDLLSLDGSFPIADWLIVSPVLQAGRAKDSATGATQDDLAVALGITFDRGAVGASLDYSYTMSQASDGSLDDRNQVLAIGVNWSLLKARERRPGVDLFVNANWADADAGPDAAGIPLSRQLFVGLRAGYAVASR